MENEFTPELIEKAKTAASAAALLALAKENGVDLTAEEAADCYAKLHPEAGKLADEELDGVTGGALDIKGNFLIVCPACLSKNITIAAKFDAFGACRCNDCGNAWQHGWGVGDPNSDSGMIYNPRKKPIT